MQSKSGRRYAEPVETGSRIHEAPPLSVTPQLESINPETEPGMNHLLGTPPPNENVEVVREPSEHKSASPAQEEQVAMSSGGSQHSLLSSGQLYKSENGEMTQTKAQSGGHPSVERSEER